MRIAEAHVHHLEPPVVVECIISTSEVDVVDSTVVPVMTDDGKVGDGEAAATYSRPR